MKSHILIASPHPDDACFSIGGSICKYAYKNILVWDVFNVQAYSLIKAGTEEAKLRIIEEEREALRIMGASVIFEDMPEAGLRGYKRLSQILGNSILNGDILQKEQGIYEAIKSAFGRLIAGFEPGWLGLPLGCGGHIDHILLREAGISCWNGIPDNRPYLFFYEELPYAANDKWLEAALDECSASGLRLHERLIPIDDLSDAKEALISVYQSQIRSRDISLIMQHSKKFKAEGAYERIWIAAGKRGESNE